MKIFISEALRYYDEDGEWNYEGDFDLESFLESLRPQMALAAQKVYDNWGQNEEGYDEYYGSGGICHDIASAMASVVYENAPDDEEIGTFGFRDDSQCHNWFVAYHPASKEMYEVDIPFYHYEKGGGYTWQKLKNIKFTPDHITINSFAGDYDDWVDEDGEPRDIDF